MDIDKLEERIAQAKASKAGIMISFADAEYIYRLIAKLKELEWQKLGGVEEPEYNDLVDVIIENTEGRMWRICCTHWGKIKKLFSDSNVAKITHFRYEKLPESELELNEEDKK